MSNRGAFTSVASLLLLPTALVVGCAALLVEIATHISGACSSRSAIWGAVAALVVVVAAAGVALATWNVAERVIPEVAARQQMRLISLICIVIVGVGAAGYVLLAVALCGYQF